ncbi:unnamed protein product [Leuciscus chuanchicus]
MGIPQRALLTLPQGLVIGRSSISNAGLGVFNQGQTVPLGMHFGPLDGEVTSEEKALDSAYSWVIYSGNNQYSYIDAERDTHSNWMKFVVCSMSETEQNLVAFQQNGRILFRCCRPISPGQEFRVWYAEEYAQGLGTLWDKIWNKKCISLGTTEEQATQRSHPDQYAHFTQTQPLESEDHSTVIDIDQCLLAPDAAPPTHMQPMTESCQAGTEGDTEMNSDKHDPTYEPPTRVKRSAKNPLRGSSHPKKVSVGRPRGRPPKNKQAAEVEVQKSLPICTECEQRFSDLETLKTHQCAGQDNNRIGEPQEAPASQHVCGECLRAFSNFDILKDHECIQQGDGSYCCSHCNLYFNRMCNLRRHERTIHSKEKPYCCTLCLKSFTQSSGLKRHQQSHSRRKAHRQSSALVNATIFPCTYCPFSFTDERYLYKHIRRHHPEMSVKYLSFQEGGVFQETWKMGK